MNDLNRAFSFWLLSTVIRSSVRPSYSDAWRLLAASLRSLSSFLGSRSVLRCSGLSAKPGILLLALESCEGLRSLIGRVRLLLSSFSVFFLSGMSLPSGEELSAVLLLLFVLNNRYAAGIDITIMINPIRNQKRLENFISTGCSQTFKFFY